jgi:hypothetical protein
VGMRRPTRDWMESDRYSTGKPDLDSTIIQFRDLWDLYPMICMDLYHFLGANI